MAAGTTDVSAQEWWDGLTELPPGLHVIEVDSTYTISGFTRDDILREMYRKGPGTDQLGPRLGLHVSQWRYSYEYTRSGSSRRCRVLEAQVLLRSVVVVPDWTNVSTVAPHVSAGWRSFLQALKVHEDGHRQRAKALGATLWTSLLGLEGTDCTELEAMVRATAEDVLADGQEAQLAYDRQTGHGATQGATWP